MHSCLVCNSYITLQKLMPQAINNLQSNLCQAVSHVTHKKRPLREGGCLINLINYINGHLVVAV